MIPIRQSLYIKVSVIVARIASNRSSTPPWPGKKFPESFTPAFLLIYDSNKSPARAQAQKIKLENKSLYHTGGSMLQKIKYVVVR